MISANNKLIKVRSTNKDSIVYLMFQLFKKNLRITYVCKPSCFLFLYIYNIEVSRPNQNYYISTMKRLNEH